MYNYTVLMIQIFLFCIASAHCGKPEHQDCGTNTSVPKIGMCTIISPCPYKLFTIVMPYTVEPLYSWCMSFVRYSEVCFIGRFHHNNVNLLATWLNDEVYTFNIKSDSGISPTTRFQTSLYAWYHQHSITLAIRHATPCDHAPLSGLLQHR